MDSRHSHTQAWISKLSEENLFFKENPSLIPGFVFEEGPLALTKLRIEVTILRC